MPSVFRGRIVINNKIERHIGLGIAGHNQCNITRKLEIHFIDLYGGDWGHAAFVIWLGAQDCALQSSFFLFGKRQSQLLSQKTKKRPNSAQETPRPYLAKRENVWTHPQQLAETLKPDNNMGAVCKWHNRPMTLFSSCDIIRTRCFRPRRCASFIILQPFVDVVLILFGRKKGRQQLLSTMAKLDSSPVFFFFFFTSLSIGAY